MNGGLTAQAEHLRVEAWAALDPEQRSGRGQFFTPQRAADLVASLPVLSNGRQPLHVLDPGAGSGILSAALVERIVREQPGRPVSVTVVDVDPALLPALHRTAALCQEWGDRYGSDVYVEVQSADFVDVSTGLVGTGVGEGFDLVIMNPPYLKLGSRSRERLALARLGVDCPNIYAVFLALGVMSLRPGGQMAAITPRSFANGPYFGEFRRFLLDAAAVNRVHTFESRGSVFSDTGVLQENIVFAVTKGSDASQVRVSVSRDHEDQAREYVIEYSDFVRPSDPHKFLRITTNEEDTATAKRMLSLPNSLTDLGLRVSTGRVVDFRVRGNLRETPGPEDQPLVYPGNVRDGKVEWPRIMKKAQGFRVLNDVDAKALMPSGEYVLVKRFSAKEERRRIVAGRWSPVENGDLAVAFENHLNVFHNGGGGLDAELAWGLTLWLNSSLVDQYFRTFSGHTQVNATDLRSLRYPDMRHLRNLARAFDSLPAQADLDRLVDDMQVEVAV